MADNNLVNDLNNLLEYLYDSRNGFDECSNQVSDTHLKALFSDFVKQRESLIQSLAQAIQSLGGAPVQAGSATAAFHRVFVDLKSLLTGGDKEAITNEVSRGETTMLNRYHDVVKENMPEAVKALLNQQINIIETSLSKIEASANT